ncbi:YkgJ family cysteine cluster protein [Wukongibacter baidiensis]|uniref:YkgJ family cysteine cluster protein n=1 Tax=Wukongibacter baidiensis TaxID=1723361 RepID=UPI003D7FBA75
MRLLKKNIEKSIEHGEEKEFFNKLNKIYEGIQGGECKGCTNCCMESVNTFYIEFLNIYKYLQDRPDLYQKLIPKVMEYYFLELVENRPCPFLDESGRCTIYEVRPLTCRLFGHLSEKEHNENYKNVLEENRESRDYFMEEYGIEIPEEIVNYKIEYCKDFKVDKRVKKQERHSMIDDIFVIESNFFMNDLISEEFLGTGLVSWFAYTYFDLDEAGDYRLDIMEEYAEQGKSSTLEEVLEKVASDKF